jgi:hypothetical protein
MVKLSASCAQLENISEQQTLSQETGSRKCTPSEGTTGQLPTAQLISHLQRHYSGGKSNPNYLKEKKKRKIERIFTQNTRKRNLG